MACCPKPGAQHFSAACIPFFHLLSSVMALPHFNYKLSRLQASLFLWEKPLLLFSACFRIIFYNPPGWIWGDDGQRVAEQRLKKIRVVIVRGKVPPAAHCCGGDKVAPNAEVAVDFLGWGRLYLLGCRQSPGHFQRALKYPLTISSAR